MCIWDQINYLLLLLLNVKSEKGNQNIGNISSSSSKNQDFLIITIDLVKLTLTYFLIELRKSIVIGTLQDRQLKFKKSVILFVIIYPQIRVAIIIANDQTRREKLFVALTTLGRP